MSVKWAKPPYHIQEWMAKLTFPQLCFSSSFFFGFPPGIRGFAPTNPDPTRVAHLEMMGESPSGGCCIHKDSNSRPYLSWNKPLTT
ncbi:hypothetical protein SLEP1_g34404 [Rubroshorea leprosula]|uniref:Uncharacterized protein n=1 Tax=Rubroshorea leprosula TaxID=152421 RepID=A0AAV5KK25_9ROSI|nr:hypothetical protein SLEP1_g34404 [Rubroshorea leprosula]